jgi:hypothetical protein
MLGFEQGMGKVANFMVCGRFLFETTKDWFLEVDPQDNLCHHVSGMERLAY